MRRLRRIVLYCGLGVIGLLVLFYVTFLIAMRVTEAEWLGKAPFHASIDVHEKSDHQIALLDEGIVSLDHRLRLIDGATKTLDLEFFIYELDASSRIVSQALAAKAKAGVKVRVLVDFSLAVFKLRPAYARLFKDAGVDVKYYNTASIARFFSVQHRTHRKLVLADGQTAILGGRNIGNDYFDLSEHYNFLDSDISLSGPVVRSVQESFNLYWTSPWALDPSLVDDEADVDAATVGAFLTPTEADIALRQRVTELAAARPPPESVTCPDVRFVTDYPGSGVKYRRVFPAIVETLALARHAVLVESPYFVIRPDGADVMKGLTTRGVRLRVLTNSLRSTDAYYTVAAMLPTLGRLATEGFELWAYRGDPLPGYPNVGNSPRYGVHGKRAVIDDDIVLIGTYNIDPRSANLNSELMVVCRGGSALASAVRGSIERRIGQSSPIIQGSDVHGLDLVEGAERRSIAMMILSLPVSTMFDFLL